eukprot:758599-Hanusia_phi.AAC.4
MSNKVDLPIVVSAHSAAPSMSETSSLSDGDRIPLEDKTQPGSDEPRFVLEEQNSFRTPGRRNLFKPDISKLLSPQDPLPMRESKAGAEKLPDVEMEEKHDVRYKHGEDGWDDSNDSVDSTPGWSLTSQHKSVQETAPVHEGLLWKKARRLLGVLQTRKCLVNHDAFVYTRAAEEEAATEVHIKLCYILAIESSGLNILTHDLHFDKVRRTKEFTIWTSKRSYSFVCETQQDCYSWLLSFQHALSVHHERCSSCSTKRSGTGKQDDVWDCLSYGTIKDTPPTPDTLQHLLPCLPLPPCSVSPPPARTVATLLLEKTGWVGPPEFIEG